MEKLRQNLKLFNYRPIVLVFLSVISGIFSATFYSKFLVLTIVCIVGLLLIITLYSILHKTYKYLIITVIFFCIGFGSYTLYIHKSTYTASSFVEQSISGEVVEMNINDLSVDLLLTDVVVNNSKLDYNIEVYYNNTKQVGYVNIKVGDIVKFRVNKQYDVKYIQDNGIPYTYNLDNNIGIRVSTQEIEIVDSHLTARNKILNKIKSNLYFGLNNENAKMIYSSMFGDKSNLSDNLYHSYKSAGVAHLLAVSGLHVGLIIAILYWILKKLKVKDIVRVIILGIILLVYAYLCNFSYSVVRACIMAIVLLSATLFYSEYDLMNSICFAGCIISIIQPIALFDVSFLLSFGCMLGICMIYPILSRGFNKIKINNALSESLAISFATFISTFAIMASYFGGFQPIMIVSNLILLPIFGILFTICFIIAIISLVIPYSCYLLMLINPVLSCFNWLIIWLANIGIGFKVLPINYLTIMLWFILLSFIGQLYLKSTASKLVITSALLVLISIQVYAIQ